MNNSNIKWKIINASSDIMLAPSYMFRNGDGVYTHVPINVDIEAMIPVGSCETHNNLLHEFITMINENNNCCQIVKVIFNNPATIILWEDGTKTVVKSENESYDPEKGMAMAMLKKYLGNKGNYYNIFRKWLPKKESK